LSWVMARRGMDGVIGSRERPLPMPCPLIFTPTRLNLTQIALSIARGNDQWQASLRLLVLSEGDNGEALSMDAGLWWVRAKNW
jgi:hypothetical protein